MNEDYELARQNYQSAKRILTQESLYMLIKDGNEVVSYNIEDYSITLIFCDGSDSMSIEFYIDEEGKIQGRVV
ncbi:hypothetical protein [Bacillus sp. UNC438CL73TsuS30]|uniref:hypothetical protein n=1 Tax=Bacillus sp. UNC438CL73TsuS30 TaxID=1340434 RepID=UPI00047C435E|nr:hypothetical protein [Bacillus sp. UNC438CL73TsuS30]